jgi:ribokinase
MSPDVVVVASWNADLSSRVARPPARGETLMGDGFEVSPGGKGSNAAVAAARQGARVAVLARIGRDDFGRMALALWTGEGIDTQTVEQVPDEPSGVAQILTYPDGDNSIVVSPGANAGLGPVQVAAAAPLIGACRVAVASFEVPLPATLAAFRLARAGGALTLLNPAPAQTLPAELAGLVDVLTPNQTEVCVLAGLPMEADPAEAARALLALGVGAVVVTLGKEGAVLFRSGHTPHTVPGWTVPVTDTVGAGDTFTGALAAALARGVALPDALPIANAAAALSVRGRGAIAGMPSLSEVGQWLATHAA